MEIFENVTFENVKLQSCEFKPETIDAFRKMCSEKREFLEYLVHYGNAFEKSAAVLVLKVGSQEARKA